MKNGKKMDRFEKQVFLNNLGEFLTPLIIVVPTVLLRLHARKPPILIGG